MKLISFVLATLFVSAASAAAPDPVYSWTPKIFELDMQGMQISLDVMEGSDDPSYIAVKQIFPEVDAEYIPTFDYYFRKNVQSRLTPREFHFNSLEDQSLDYASEEFIEDTWSLVKYMGANLYERIVRTFYVDPYVGSVSYGYCEANPEYKQYPCESDERSSLYSFVVRSVSNPYFVNYTCDSILPFFVWEVEFGAQKKLDYKRAKEAALRGMERVDKTLAYLENGGVWQIDPDFIAGANEAGIDSYTTEFIVRRYYDGGPKLMKAVRKCLDKARAQVAAASKQSGNDASVTAKISEIIRIKPLTSVIVPLKTFEISDNKLHRRDVYRLLRQIDAKAELPSYAADEINYGLVDSYYEDDSDLDGEQMRAITRILSRLDNRYNYRLFTKDELELFITPPKPQPQEPQSQIPQFADGSVPEDYVTVQQDYSVDGQTSFCLSDKGQKEFTTAELYYNEAPSYHELAPYDPCHMRKWRIVREAK